MADRKDIDKANSDASATPDNTPRPALLRSNLPSVESPPLSPVAGEPAPVTGPEAIRIDPIEDTPRRAQVSDMSAGETPAAETPTTESAAAPEVAPPMLDEKPASTSRPFAFRARHKRYALLAASVTIASALGVVIGSLASGGFAKPEAPRVDVAGLEERKAMQQTIAHLSKEVTALKSNLDAANKMARTQIAKLNDKLNDKLAERVKKESAEVTGSISAPQTAAPAPAPTEQPIAVPTPMPPPRPPQVASVEPPPAPTRPSIVPGWRIRDAHDGLVYVEGNGEIYEVVPGAPLPGLGPVEQIRRQDGRWVVVTPRGIIVSMRDRRYFESF
jgi:hypothetical protein